MTCANTTCSIPVYADAIYCSAWCWDAHTKREEAVEAFQAPLVARDYGSGLRARLGLPA